MARRAPSTSPAGQASRRERPDRISLQSRHSSTAPSVSSQESDSPSRFGTALGTPITPATRLPSPFFESGRDRTHKAFPGYILFDNTSRSVSSGDDQPGPSEDQRTPKRKGKEPEVYEDDDPLESIAMRLSQMEDKLDLLLPLLNKLLRREKQPLHEEKPEPATEEQIQSSQTYQNLKADNDALEAKLETAQKKLIESQHNHEQTLRELQALKELSDPEVNKRKGREIKVREMTPDNYQYAIHGWLRALDFCEEGWTMATKYKEEKVGLEKEIRELQNTETLFLKEICDLHDANKELRKMVEAHDLENIVRGLTDCTSRTEPQAEPGSNTGLIGRDPDTKGETQLYGKGALDINDTRDGEEIQQGSEHEDQHERLEDGLEQNQEEAPPAEQGEQQKDKPKEESAVQPELREPYEGQSQDRQEEAVENPQEGQQGIEEDRQEETMSLEKKIARGEEELKELTSTRQELVTGGHTEPELPEQQNIVETAIGNNQSTVETTADDSPPETQDVVVANTAPEPDTTEPVDSPDSGPVTSAEPRPKRDHHRHSKHRHRRREDRDHERNRGHRRERDERQNNRPNHRNNRPGDTERRIQRRQQQGPVPYWERSPSWMKTYFRTGLRDLIRSLKIRIRG